MRYLFRAAHAVVVESNYDEVLLRTGRYPPSVQQRILELEEAMRKTSICGLGQSAGWAVTDAIRRWPDLLAYKETLV